MVTRVRSAQPDLRQYQASSLGETPELWLQAFDGRSADVLVRTHSTVQSIYSPPGTKASGRSSRESARSSLVLPAISE